ncbi:hypothetical protein GQ43DRAFT_140654 [Delitschia confertaspora ATCC 74209]|uniref:Zn(2)-C6 fungal-type domain-containing protein n=1 Tax=Delitschia confertaspora ATCC 74209 TaxID=1513339 RepID=A0A9P4JIE1_9PLEO|nr:hypothetical protein GQ43DRAFT_140654 [Delitschia confertaspora ATCC 74209]
MEDHLNMTTADAFLDFGPFDPTRSHQYNFNLNAQTWPMPLDPTTMPHPHDSQSNAHHQQSQRRMNTVATTSPNAQQVMPTTSGSLPLQTNGLGYSSAMPNGLPQNTGLVTDWIPQLSAFTQQSYNQDLTGLGTSDFGSYGGQLQTSPVDYNLSTSQALMNTTLSMDGPANYMALTTGPMDMNQMSAPYQMADFQQELSNFPTTNSASNSPTESWLEVRSLSDNGWSAVEMGPSRHSFDFSNETVVNNLSIFNPGQTLHIRTNSDSSQQSDVPRSAHSFSSYEEINFPMNSPQSEAENSLELVQTHAVPHGLPHHDHAHHDHDYAFISPNQSVSPPTSRVEPILIKHPASSSASPTSSAASSPTNRRKKSPTGIKDKVTKTIVKKTAANSNKKDPGEKRVGRRRGPLRPEQRQQAHEIRKLRACLRCKFLKKTCDKGDPCGGCQPSHARLWQVPCTRIDIKDIAYFMKDWRADYERHVSLGFSVGNIKGFSPQERTIYITHGYGQYLPINAREVYVRDDKCFNVDWMETMHEKPLHFETNTAKLSAGMDGISHTMLSEYLDRHIDGGFECFVDEYFEGTYFLTEILKTAYRFYLREKLPVIRKALKLVVAYTLTLHVTMMHDIPEEDLMGKVEHPSSKFFGKTVAPVMINFQIKCALADMWRELQKDVLEELSALYSSVYSGEKLKNWPTIFMLAAILLGVWELIQFDCHYRVPDQSAVQKFCNDMESTPVGVIVGLFSAISQKLPAFTEWDTRKHHQLLNSNPAVCDAMTEVRAHVSKYESYLRSRSDCKFDRNDFDCLSNKFLSKLVIRAN